MNILAISLYIYQIHIAYAAYSYFLHLFVRTTRSQSQPRLVFSRCIAEKLTL
jgi:hypothetical protein